MSITNTHLTNDQLLDYTLGLADYWVRLRVAIHPAFCHSCLERLCEYSLRREVLEDEAQRRLCDHLTQEEIAAYDEGRLDQDRFDMMTLHCAQCRACEPQYRKLVKAESQGAGKTSQDHSISADAWPMIPDKRELELCASDTEADHEEEEVERFLNDLGTCVVDGVSIQFCEDIRDGRVYLRGAIPSAVTCLYFGSDSYELRETSPDFGWEIIRLGRFEVKDFLEQHRFDPADHPARFD